MIKTAYLMMMMIWFMQKTPNERAKKKNIPSIENLSEKININDIISHTFHLFFTEILGLVLRRILKTNPNILVKKQVKVCIIIWLLYQDSTVDPTLKKYVWKMNAGTNLILVNYKGNNHKLWHSDEPSADDEITLNKASQQLVQQRFCIWTSLEDC